jgi:ribosomal protein S18 acetylase RimI-like enzyme
MTEIIEVSEVTTEVVATFERLVPQLNPSCRPPTREELTQIVQSPTTVLLAAYDPDCTPPLVGVLTLAVFRVPTGIRAWIEDVVVDTRARGRGVAEALCRAALSRAVAMGASSIDLTSRPDREAANRLYQRLGFQRRDTNVYRLNL